MIILSISKEELVKKLQRNYELLGNPTAYHLDLNKIHTLEKETKALEDQYKALPIEVIEAGTLTFKTLVEYQNPLFTIKRGSTKYYASDDNLSSIHTEFIVNEKGMPIKALRTIINSDTKGMPKIYSYDIVIEEPKFEEPKPKKKREPPCSKIDEGMATLKTDDAYFKSMGLVKDANTKQWRRPTPQEYDEFSKKVAEKKKEKKKK